MSGSREKREPFFYCDMCHGIMPLDVGDRDDVATGQLVMAAVCVLIGFVYWLVLWAGS